MKGSEMSERISRRDFVKVGTAVSVAASVPAAALGQGPSVLVRKATPPVVIASANGHQYKNGGPRTCVEEAYQRIVKGEDVLDALIAGVNIVELDPDGHQRRLRRPAQRRRRRAARLLLHARPHEARRRRRLRSRACARRRWWPRPCSTTPTITCWWGRAPRRSPATWASRSRTTSTPSARARSGSSGSGGSTRSTTSTRRSEPRPARPRVAQHGARTACSTRSHRYGTINCNGVSAKGEVCGVTTTSGLAFKIPGRVGDSPILGAGLWVDGEVGAAGSTGRGEANLYNLSSFLIVEELRRGRSAEGRRPGGAAPGAGGDGGEAAARPQRELPSFQLSFYVLTKKGEYAGVAMWGNDGSRPRALRGLQRERARARGVRAAPRGSARGVSDESSRGRAERRRSSPHASS